MGGEAQSGPAGRRQAIGGEEGDHRGGRLGYSQIPRTAGQPQPAALDQHNLVEQFAEHAHQRPLTSVDNDDLGGNTAVEQRFDCIHDARIAVDRHHNDGNFRLDYRLCATVNLDACART